MSFHTVKTTNLKENLSPNPQRSEAVEDEEGWSKIKTEGKHIATRTTPLINIQEAMRLNVLRELGLREDQAENPLQSHLLDFDDYSVHKLSTIPIALTEYTLYKELQNGKGKGVSNRTRRQIYQALEELSTHMKPRGIFRFFPIKGKDGRVTIGRHTRFASKNLQALLKQCKRVAVFVTTLGDEVDHIINQAMKKRPHYGYILNLAASTAADMAAMYIQDHIKCLIPRNETTTYRYSPGYCDWPLKEQSKLFELIPHHSVGVDLSDTFLMSPSKSVSGLIGICSSHLNIDLKNLCKKCRRTQCSHRRK